MRCLCLIGVEKLTEKKFCVQSSDRTAQSQTFLKFICTGSTIYTEGWAAYKTVCLEMGFEIKL